VLSDDNSAIQKDQYQLHCFEKIHGKNRLEHHRINGHKDPHVYRERECPKTA